MLVTIQKSQIWATPELWGAEGVVPREDLRSRAERCRMCVTFWVWWL